MPKPPSGWCSKWTRFFSDPALHQSAVECHSRMYARTRHPNSFALCGGHGTADWTHLKQLEEPSARWVSFQRCLRCASNEPLRPPGALASTILPTHHCRHRRTRTALRRSTLHHGESGRHKLRSFCSTVSLPARYHCLSSRGPQGRKNSLQKGTGAKD